MWMDKLERKMGRFAIPHLMRYIIFGNVIVLLISLFQPYFMNYLILDREAVLQGQVWRLLTFILIPPSSGNILLTAISLYCYYWIGGALEATWGSFRFNLFYLIGILATIAVSMIFDVPGIPVFLNQVLFLALASLYPDQPILLMYFIPMKAKWAGVISAAFLVYDFMIYGPIFRLLILAALVNYMIFFVPVWVQKIKYKKRRQSYERMTRPQPQPRKTAQPGKTVFTAKGDKDKGKIITGVPFHRCHICGITDVDDPNMTFRYCSQCNGNFEYCENHLHNHEHVK